jgi:hypothetical protein
MADDIVARLREAGGGYFVSQLHNAAADEIELARSYITDLTIEVERLRREATNG